MVSCSGDSIVLCSPFVGNQQACDLLVRQIGGVYLGSAMSSSRCCLLVTETAPITKSRKWNSHALLKAFPRTL